jgi:hypothetical protein
MKYFYVFQYPVMTDKRRVYVGLILSLVFCSTASLAQSNQADYRMSLFNDYDFQIIENYIRLKSNSDGECHELLVKSEEMQVAFYFVCNHHGWKAIRITSLEGFEPGVDYYLNHEVPGAGRRHHSTVLTSSRGEKTNVISFRHFYLILEQVKRELLSADYIHQLSQYLLSKDGTKQGELTSSHIHFEMRTVDQTEGYLEISPDETYSPVIVLPYRIWEKKTKRRLKIRWEYLVKEEHRLPDDFFFMNFSNLLLQSKPLNLHNARNLP